ncbi:MAG: prolyl oligopeptidase family serine peptidase [Prevotellaceae bacterium]|nr:prolyl oligopeptidase family serine peptidase [Prevotellaceae bacterium]
MNKTYQKMIGLAMAALLTSSYGICQNPTDETGAPTGPIPGVGRPMPEMSWKKDDARLQAVLDETVHKFIQCTYTDAQTGKTMEYNLYIPESYDDKTDYPLILFIGDASTAHREVTVPLTQGYGGVIWATAAEQAKHPCFIVVPQYTTVTVNDKFETSDEVEMTIRLIDYICSQYTIDTKRLYTTGQSMGGMMSMYFNVAHPKYFAASLYAGCQWDTSKMAGFATDSFIYAVAGGDERASHGMAQLRQVLEAEGKQISSAEWSAKLPEEEQKANTLKLLSEGNNVNFIVLTKGSVMPEGSGNQPGGEHMHSFDYIYKLEAARDWIFQQRLE